MHRRHENPEIIFASKTKNTVLKTYWGILRISETTSTFLDTAEKVRIKNKMNPDFRNKVCVKAMDATTKVVNFNYMNIFKK